MNLSAMLTLIGAGFALGWATNNFVYGRKGCTDCFIALVRGKGCSTCENNPKQGDN